MNKLHIATAIKNYFNMIDSMKILVKTDPSFNPDQKTFADDDDIVAYILNNWSDICDLMLSHLPK